MLHPKHSSQGIHPVQQPHSSVRGSPKARGLRQLCAPGYTFSSHNQPQISPRWVVIGSAVIAACFLNVSCARRALPTAAHAEGRWLWGAGPGWQLWRSAPVGQERKGRKDAKKCMGRDNTQFSYRSPLPAADQSFAAPRGLPPPSQTDPAQYLESQKALRKSDLQNSLLCT